MSLYSSVSLGMVLEKGTREPPIRSRPCPVSALVFLAGAEEVMKDTEPVMIGDGPGPAVQPHEALGEVGVHPAEVGPCLIDILLGDGLLDNAGYLEFIPLALVGGNQGFN